MSLVTSDVQWVQVALHRHSLRVVEGTQGPAAQQVERKVLTQPTAGVVG